ncbi:FAD-binding oxidoreductase [Naasia aerilata]|uniref:FAD-linked oxidase n=1 Tax=Naasia aerilata TaxID=1162966 RepID=A0ABM8GFL7_9MICO|nr:FAD-binding protein [Naasia aerilata]BDZ47136.1 FAD-linked oxidase [Naasia aerilata]
MSIALAAALRSAGASTVLLPGDAGFQDELTGFNLHPHHSPDVVVAARTAGDVAAAVRVAQDEDLPVMVLGLGHGMLKDARGGIVITTRGLASVQLDLENRLVRVGAGTQWKEVLDTVTPHGLAALCGSSPEVGVVGFVLGGGMGPIARSYGFAADHVESIEIVTPAQGLVHASPTENPELFWALRGGKTGFGVVTAVTLDVFPIETIYGGGLYFDEPDVKKVLDTFASWSKTLPLCASASIGLIRVPPLPDIPEPLRGKFVAHLRFAALDDAVRGEEILAPIRAVATPLLDMVGMLPYSQIGLIHSDPTTPMPVNEGGMLLESFDQEVVDALWAAVGPEAPVPLIMAEIRTLGGKVAEQAAEPNAVSGRGAAYSLFLLGAPVPELLDTVIPEVIHGVFGRLEQWRAEELLINFVGRANGPDALDRVWKPEIAERLDAVRRAADPEGLFAFDRRPALVG